MVGLTIFHLYKVVAFVDICDKLSFTRVTIISCLKRNFKKTTTTKDYQANITVHPMIPGLALKKYLKKLLKLELGSEHVGSGR